MEYELTGVLAGLQRLGIADLHRYKNALNRTSRICWQHFFPFLYFYYCVNGREDLLIEEIDGSICLYRISVKDGKPYLLLYFLPFPMNPGALRHCLARVREFNQHPRAVIYWVDEEEFGGLAGLWEVVRAYPMNREYLYNPGIYRALAGKTTRNLRRNLEKIFVRDDVEVRDFTPADIGGCLGLLDEWAGLQKDKYEQISYQRYTRNCVEFGSRFAAPDLFGKVILVGGEIRSFGFAGEIRRGLANLFITYSDLNIKGLNQYLYYQLLLDLEDCELANAAMADTPGLKFAKEALCPVSTHGMFRVHVNPEE